MLSVDFAAYLGKESEGHYTGFIADGGFFAVLKTQGETAKENGSEFLKNLSSDISNVSINTLHDFDTFLTDQFRNSNLSAHSVLSCAYRMDEKCLLKTIGEGEIYIRRGNAFEKLIGHDKSASGFLESEDLLVLTISSFTHHIGDRKELWHFIGNKSPLQIHETFVSHFQEKEPHGALALFVHFTQKKEEVQDNFQYEQPAVTPVQTTQLPSKKTDFITPLKKYFDQLEFKKKIIVLAVSVLFLFFLWNLIFGYQRRESAKLDELIETKREIIEGNLTQAEDVAFLNVGRARALFAQSNEVFAELKKETKGKKSREIAAIEKYIKEKEGSIFKKEERPSAEFFDLTIESKKATGRKLYLDGENIGILDPAGSVYVLSISKKSLDVRSSSEAKTATNIALAENGIFIINPNGIFMSAEDKFERVVEAKEDWGKIVDVALFNSNLYLLDSEKKEIHKYSPAESGYGGRTSYFKSKQDDMNAANSLAIDQSVYVGLPTRILKFTSGLRDGFTNTFPEDINITKIVTSADLEKIYAWDKKKGAIYVIAKTGSYERQIKSQILSNANDVVVFENTAYVLSGPKIYKVSLD